ncbi:hypothetical protein [Sphingomonas sp. SORGH_AS_0879]|uniref:hypothetical protein n=1 Tax=Sphingomonas sp. SORGH_AS_0879 TaxID=3041790 RepID=UPI00277D948C|nr:hypothetical protein [Sphingomonas sp. SORGH_AS_0879]MDQ1230109.1 TolA-binding protein [Sphingomonas sp. SORGH_AS_0879]
MRRAAALILLTLAPTLTLTACDQRGSPDARVADGDAQERSRQEKAANDIVGQTEDQVRVRVLEQRVAALEVQVAAMQGDRKLLDAQLVEQRLNQIEARNVGDTASSPISNAQGDTVSPDRAAKTRAPGPSATPAARKPLVLDLR